MDVPCCQYMPSRVYICECMDKSETSFQQNKYISSELIYLREPKET